MESCFSGHTFIHTYPPATSKLTWHPERSSHKQQVHDGDDGDKPNVAGWQCCAPESWAFWASGERRERFVKNGRPRAASKPEPTQPYHEVCGMGAWQSWALDNKLSFRDYHHPQPLPTDTIYVFTCIRRLPLWPFLPPSGGARANPDEQDFAQAVQAVGR